MSDNRQPLAEQMRPQTLDEVIGQSHLLGEGELLRRIIKNGEPVSLILWGFRRGTWKDDVGGGLLRAK